MFEVNLRGTKCVEIARVEWIDVGEEESTRLEGEEAREWLIQAAKKEP